MLSRPRDRRQASPTEDADNEQSRHSSVRNARPRLRRGHATILLAASRGGQAFAIVAAAVAELSSSDSSRIFKQDVRARRDDVALVARDALIETMDAIARTARAIAIDSTPRVPLRRRGTAQATVHQHHMPPDFLDALGKDIEHLERAIGNSAEARGTGVVAKTQIRETLDSALTAVRRLDAIALNTFRDDAATTALW